MKQNKETVKEYFETGDKPTQAQYSDLIDSYVDVQQEPGEANRRFVIDETGEVSVTSEQEIPDYTLSEITNNKIALLKDGISIQEIDLTSYIDDTNLARLVSGSVDENGLATFTRDDETTFTLDFSFLLSQELNFADDSGNLKYTSNIDKRTGYYDIVNETYYPGIIELQVNKKYKIQQPIDSHFFVSSNKIAIKLPSHTGVISFDIDIYNRTGFSGQNESLKIHVKGEIQNNTWTTYNNPSADAIKQNHEYNFHFCRKDGEFYVFLENINTNISLIECHISNLFIYNRFLSLTKPLDWYSGWGFDTNNLSTYTIDFTVTNKDSIPLGKVNIHDSNGMLLTTTNNIKLGAGLGFNTDTNEIFIE